MGIESTPFETLAADLDRAVEELIAAIGADPAAWGRARQPGKWTVGHHAAHVGITLDRTATLFEDAERSLRAGMPAPPLPGRGLFQSLLVSMFLSGYMPRGAPTAAWAVPSGLREHDATIATIRSGARRHREVGERISADERARLWISNPFRPQWHYRLPEMVRVHAVHTRHHAKQIRELVAA
ncbi:MAG TPA: hypothetical protein VJY35_00685 [Candidatus Eisenbacteria bacterium]|nr:hypothetical protein [Candidatus Eisenbacteria bacterium]